VPHWTASLSKPLPKSSSQPRLLLAVDVGEAILAPRT
jgi:hypothetical protein